MLEARNVGFRYRGGRPVLRDVSFSLTPGRVMCLLGPNGTGKTTLLRCLLGLCRPDTGRFLWDGRDLSSMSRRGRARLMAYVPQSSALTFPYEVQEVVLMGRVAHLGLGNAPGREDRRKAASAMDRMEIGHLRGQVFQRLSGGERQMVLMARALAQEARLLVLDEPTANLDFSNQVRTLGTIRSLAQQGYAVLMTSHSPDHAFLTAHEALLLRNGTVYAHGAPDEVIDGPTLSELYGTPTVVSRAPVAGGGHVKVCIPVLGNEDGSEYEGGTS